ncbi:1-hydroxycarotenoid 3,4-desaturase CrtD [Falsiroseomonas oryzae]|uniref:1-hydroxycarotenoid 3,4-desaturase CrtD n=1 Tax=Falsiroseomonas oryzae TaxID=2766473 RepID=UPI0022EB1AAE|nr:1-hydroxycarotenoid 3,4-desaturase CrtD [Roseomonas sp. MO-31]
MGARSQVVVVIGAGIGGLVASALLAASGREVLVLERAARPGGKIRDVMVDGVPVGAGPALLTLRPVFEEIFAQAGDSLADRLQLTRQASLGRHAWVDGARLDLPVEPAAAEAAVGDFAGAAAARGYRAFRDRAKRIHDALEAPFLRAQRPGALALAAQSGLRGLLGASPFSTLWDALGDHFPQPRLRQVFARVATYVGSSPLQAPATLMLVAHVELQGLWAVQGGMIRLAEALADVARARGAAFRYEAEVREILVDGGRASGVRLADGETVPAAAVVLNADPAALGAGRFGRAASGAVDRLPPERRSFSAITWAMRAAVDGGAPAMQTVVHPDDPTAEYAEIAYRGRLPTTPTVTLWAQDRAEGAAAPDGPERLLAMVNAPARADLRPLPGEAVERCATTAFDRLRRAGVPVQRRPEAEVVTTPAEFERLFPGNGGALYGPAVHGWQAAFSRPGARTKLPGLYLVGGGTHPGAGVAMAAISGRLAAARVIEDRG